MSYAALLFDDAPPKAVLQELAALPEGDVRVGYWCHTRPPLDEQEHGAWLKLELTLFIKPTLSAEAKAALEENTERMRFWTTRDPNATPLK